jgi:cytochrome c peroxidase
MPLKQTGQFVATAVFAALLSSCATDAPDPTVAALREQVVPMFGTVTPVTAAEVQAPAAKLGRALFWDTRLSFDGKTACASCHTRDAWSSDKRRRSTTAKGELTTLHSQAMFMAQDQASLRWYGDRSDGKHQAERSIGGSMGMPSPSAMVSLLRRYGYEAAFASAFPGQDDPLTPANYGAALQAYQRTLRTPAAFDDFLAGNLRALNTQQVSGLKKFVATGCIACHKGSLLGGQSLQKFGQVKDYWLATGSSTIDLGRYNSTKKEEDKYVYRVPMLRNIAKTAPYFHDGSVDTLEAAVRVMAEVQLDRKLSDADVGDIVAFLGSLTGEMPSHYAPP